MRLKNYNRERGGLVLLILVGALVIALAIGAVCILSAAWRIQQQREEGMRRVEGITDVVNAGFKIADQTSAPEQPPVMAPPVQPIVEQSTNMIYWEHCTEAWHDIVYRLSLRLVPTNGVMFYRLR